MNLLPPGQRRWDVTYFPPVHCPGKSVWWEVHDTGQKAQCDCGETMWFSWAELKAMPERA